MKFAMSALSLHRFAATELFRRITGHSRPATPDDSQSASKRERTERPEIDNAAEYEVTPFGRRRKTVARRHRILKRTALGSGVAALGYVVWLLI